jgi:hypothetical protein
MRPRRKRRRNKSLPASDDEIARELALGTRAKSSGARMTPNVKNIEQKKLADCQYSEYLTLLTSSLNVKESDQGGTGEHENRELVDRPPRFIS